MKSVIQVKITETMMEKAEALSGELRDDFSGRGKYATALAALAILEAFPKAELIKRKTSLDVRIGSNLYEVRSEINDHQLHPMNWVHVHGQKAGTRYLFCRVALRANTVHLLGWDDVEEYFSKAKKFKRGQLMDTRGPGTFSFQCNNDSWSVRLNEIRQFSETTIDQVRERLT